MFILKEQLKKMVLIFCKQYNSSVGMVWLLSSEVVSN